MGGRSGSMAPCVAAGAPDPAPRPRPAYGKEDEGSITTGFGCYVGFIRVSDVQQSRKDHIVWCRAC